MTLCIAALCEERNTIILGADKMIGRGFIEAELEIEKIASVHPDWWVMFSGTVPHVFDIVDQVEKELDKTAHYGVAEVTTLFERCYRSKRMALAEATHLTPRGWTAREFQADGLTKLGDVQFRSILIDIAAYNLGLELVVAGFDANGTAHLFTVTNPGSASRQDIPGYCAIGNGMFGALYFMFYREMSVGMSAAEALYHVFEAKAFGYEAGGIGEETDFVVARFGREPIRLQESQLPILLDLWAKFRPRYTKGLKYHLNRYVRRHQPEKPPS